MFEDFKKKHGERKFLDLAKAMGLALQETKDHIGCWITDRDGIERSVDVKGAKTYTDDQLFLVELRNGDGDKGWLFDKTDLVAFQYKDAFICVKREDLQKLVCKLAHVTLGKDIEGNEQVRVDTQYQSFERPAVAPQHYIRADRPNECVTYITGRKLIPIKWLVVKKVDKSI